LDYQDQNGLTKSLQINTGSTPRGHMDHLVMISNHRLNEGTKNFGSKAELETGLGIKSGQQLIS